MPRMPSKRLPRGLLAAAALDALEDPPPGAAMLDRLLRTSAGSDVRVPTSKPIHLRRIVLETECT